MTEVYDLAVIGAGPAGLAAATHASNHGLDVALFDEQATPGGQIYRALEQAPDDRKTILGPDYSSGHEVVQAFRDSPARYFPNTQVWSLSPEREIGLLNGEEARMVRARRVLIASGAQERAVPFPGWTLPGITYAGGGQILLKSAGLLPDDPVVIAGTGPLLLLLAWQYQRAGVRIAALLETMSTANLIRAMPHLPRALLAHHYVTKGLAYERHLKRVGVPVVKGVSSLKALGDHEVAAVEYRHRQRTRTIETRSLLVHFGVVPQTHLSRTAGCAHRWDEAQQCWRTVVDEWGNTDIEGIAVAGDGASIGGAVAARHAGAVAAFDALCLLGRIDRKERDRLSRCDRKWLRDDLHIRPFLQKVFRVPDSLLAFPDDATILCRCEEVTAGQVRAAVAAGHRDPNQVKFLTRCGMGPCQGRQCNDAVSHLVAAETGSAPEQSNGYRVRPPVKPLPIQALAGLQGVKEVGE